MCISSLDTPLSSSLRLPSGKAYACNSSVTEQQRCRAEQGIENAYGASACEGDGVLGGSAVRRGQAKLRLGRLLSKVSTKRFLVPYRT